MVLRFLVFESINYGTNFLVMNAARLEARPVLILRIVYCGGNLLGLVCVGRSSMKVRVKKSAKPTIYQ
jgi:hypothetical protein